MKVQTSLSAQVFRFNNAEFEVELPGSSSFLNVNFPIALHGESQEVTAAPFFVLSLTVLLIVSVFYYKSVRF